MSGPLRRLPTRVVEGDARLRLRAGWPWRLLERPRRLELLCLPAWLVTARVRDAGGEARRVHLLGDGVEGTFGAFAEDVPLEVSPAGAEVLPFAIDEAQARERARAVLTELALRSGMREKRPLEVEAIERVERVGRPYWVQYFRRLGRYGFRVLDAATATLERGAARRALLRAFLLAGRRAPSAPMA